MADSDMTIRVEFEYISLHHFMWRHELPADASGIMLATGNLGLSGKTSEYSRSFFTLYNQAVTFTRDSSHEATKVMFNIAQVLDEILAWRKSSKEYVEALDRTARGR